MNWKASNSFDELFMYVAFVEVVALYFLSLLYILQEMIGHQWKATSLLTVGVQSASNLPVSYLFITGGPI